MEKQQRLAVGWYEKAAGWYEEASVQGNIESRFALGVMHRDGVVFEQSHSTAISIFKKCAHVHAGAQLELGKIYNQGIGVDKNTWEAYKWFSKCASDHDSAEAHYRLGLYQQGDDRSNIRVASEAVKHYMRAEAQGHIPATVQLAKAYRDGIGVARRNMKKAAVLFRKSAKENNPDALFHLGMMYRDGLGVETSDVEAISLFWKAAELGSADAKSQLDWMRHYGRGIDALEAQKSTKQRASQMANKTCKDQIYTKIINIFFSC